MSIAGSLARRLASRTVVRGRTTSAVGMCWEMHRRVRLEGTPLRIPLRFLDPIFACQICTDGGVLGHVARR